MTHKIELLSQSDNFTIGTNSNLAEILANVVKVGSDTSNVTISIPQDISSSYNIILPVRQGASGESLVYGADGQLKWHDPTVLKQIKSVYGSTLTGNLISTSGTHDSPTYLDAYTANITPMGENSKIFVQFKVNYHAALLESNQISFFIKKTYDGNETIFTESLFGPYNAVGGFTGQYISNLVDEALTSNSISYQLGYKINGSVYATDVLGILGYDNSHYNTIVLQEFEGSGSNATSVWNKGADSNGLYYNDGTVHIGSTKNALGSQNTPGLALELSGNLVGINANFSGEVSANVIRANEGYFSSNTLYINNKPILNEDVSGNRTVNTDVIVSDASNGLTIKTIGDNGNIILDLSGTGSIQLNGDVQISGGNINAETFIGDLSGNVNAVTMTATTTTTNNLSLDGTLTTSNSTRVEGNLIPSANVTYDLGSETHMWRDVYIGPGSLYLNGTKILEDNTTEISMKTDINQGLNIETSGTGQLTVNSSGTAQLLLQSATGGIDISKTGNTGDITITTTSGGDINMNAYDNIQITAGDDLQLTSTSGTIQLKSAVNITHGMTVSNPTGDDIKIDDNLQITGQVKTNEIIEYTTNSGVTIENVLIKDGNVNGNLVGNVTGTVSSLSNLDTDHLSEGSTNLYYTTERVRGDVSGGTGINYNESTGVFSLPQEVSTSSDVTFDTVTASSSLVTHNAQINNDLTVNKDLTVAGNITVSGTQTIVNSTVVEIGDNKIVLNSSGLSTNDAGIIANVNNSQYEFYFKTDDTAWYANEAIQSGTGFIGNVTGNVTGNVIGNVTGNLVGNVTGDVTGNLVGNVTGDVTGNLVGDIIGNVTGNLVGDVTGDVTGNVSGVLTGSMTMTGHILPDTNAAYDIGSAEHKVRHMYLSNNSLWIGDEHKATINPSNNQLEFRRRKTDAIPQSFITAGINDTSQILSAAGVGELTEMTLGKWKQVARSLGITINGKSNLDIDPTDIFDTSQTDDWQTTVDVKTIADDVSVLQTSLNTVQVTADAANSLATTNATSIGEINTSLTTVQGTADAANSLATTNATSIDEINTSLTIVQGIADAANSLATTNTTSIDTINTSLASKQNTITETTDLTMQNLTLSGYLRGPTNMIIDPETHSDDTGTLTVKGSLQVLGTTTTINSETLTINDNSIILNKNYTGSSPTEDASIEIERGTSQNAIIKWNETNDQWEFYKEGTTLSNIKCDTLKVSDTTTLGITNVSVSSTTLNINGDSNSSYGVYSLSGSITTINTISVSNVGNNSQILIYYTNSSGSDLTINNTITGCKTNLSEALTVSNGSSVLFCLVNINSTYILTVSQLG